MLRYLFILLIAVLLGYFTLQSKLNERKLDLPVYLRTDTIVKEHSTNVQIFTRSLYKPDSAETIKLKNDYSNIWAHLNNLYVTNDVEAGMEFYTEDWFKQIVKHYNGKQNSIIKRMDEQHQLHIQNWSSDGLVCTAVDSNVVLHTIFAHNMEQKSVVNMAVVLLFQGDNWRLDAIRVLSQSKY